MANPIDQKSVEVIDPLTTPMSDYSSKLSSEARYRYSVKLLYDYGRCILPDPYALKTDWTDDMSVWPELGFPQIYCYLIQTPGTFTSENLQAYKSLEAYRFVVSGHVQVVECNLIGDSVPYCAFRAKVIPSQRITEKPHQPWIYLDKKTAQIYCAHCTCLAGLGEVCSHVAAVLFKVEMAVKLGLNCVASTSKSCQWNKAFRKELNPMDIKDLQPLLKGRRTKPVPSVVPSGKDPLPSEGALASLRLACPSAVFFSTIPPLDPLETETASETGEHQGAVQPLRDLYCLRFQNLSPEMKEKIWNTQTCTRQQAKELEQQTSGQAECPLWFEQRKGRITGTKAHDVLRRKDVTNPDNLIRRITGSKCYNLSRKKSVQWGNNNEDRARTQYIDQEKNKHQQLQVKSSGLLICAEKPFLAVSVDGVINCKCYSKRLLEIKCPFSHRDSKIKDIKDKDFCLESFQGGFQLKTGHRYYTQVQLQMYIHEVSSCDLFVFTTIDSVTVTVHKDVLFCTNLVNKCEAFFMNHILPELITRKLENGDEDIDETLKNNEQDSLADCDTADKDVWCLCREPEYGRMVECSNSHCPVQWFHYECVNIRRCPRGQWLCPECSEQM